MRCLCLAGLICLLLASLAYGQGVSPATVPTGKAPEVVVAPDDPVITVNDFCAEAAPPGNGCKTVITRAQFEKLCEALQPGMPVSLRLKMAAAAEKRGLDKTPAFDEEVRYARLQLLSQDLTRELQAEADNISDADLADYYKENEASYEEATLMRIFVPRTKEGETAHGEPEDAMTGVAADLRARAVTGEDPDRLQVEAYAEAGIPHTSSNTKMEKVRRDALPPQHEAVMDLKAGEVSEVFSDPGGAHFIYKMISKHALTLDDAKTEIRTAISSQRYRDSMKSFEGNVVFSDAYFNPPAKPVSESQRNRRERKKKP